MLLTLMKDYIGPNGSAVPAQVKDSGSHSYKIEFCPKIVGEHKIAVSYLRTPVAGSPFSCKVYDIKAIKVKSVPKGTVGQQVTFIGKNHLKFFSINWEFIYLTNFSGNKSSWSWKFRSYREWR